MSVLLVRQLLQISKIKIPTKYGLRSGVVANDAARKGMPRSCSKVLINKLPTSPPEASEIPNHSRHSRETHASCLSFDSTSLLAPWHCGRAGAIPACKSGFTADVRRIVRLESDIRHLVGLRSSRRMLRPILAWQDADGVQPCSGCLTSSGPRGEATPRWRATTAIIHQI